MEIKDSEALKHELAAVRERNQELYAKNVQPGIKVKMQEFLDAFEEYFRERGFVIRKKADSVTVAYDTLHFKAFSNETHDIFIMKGREQLASITVYYNGARKLVESRQNVDGSFVQFESEIEKEKALSTLFDNPVFYYTGHEIGHPYDTPLAVIDSIFCG
ncbi:hypothetical protein BACCIP111895_01939 [Neobacillus rhizosphaerae]|uniref:Uncharacterized protein n=1 Tax=Neobacillus rhizosphaerae TaxID=2880965 RepID=A0ABN8KR20_9BACI|nr:hypothetical protein [Neobacillus rhizosphaerae]CAH2714763.1 hypothetical protein BACCIP111895_01939 [Neobacillus rhizosphaerae]